ncbi:MAG: type III-A CRISPR-associated protein Cas10/Csm1 [Candidatus Aenigmarchaeota archaeon]|nr:type III-A CRISPR-associated protein Cas10/Csm1 [Candidatus Aenigmarchaeota archaeon]MDW8160182.1 type III-A CRISPR-associated protein Cas10/Csm1 [Candidatus Aenigmarchaeota archaeon]
MEQSYLELLISSLLHDIGKYYKFETNSNHVRNSEEFCEFLIEKLKKNEKLKDSIDFDKIKNLVKMHHSEINETTKYSQLLMLLKECDADSASERGVKDIEEEKKKRTETPMIAPINYVSKEEKNIYFKPARLSEIIETLDSIKSDENRILSEHVVTTKTPDPESLSNFYSKEKWRELEDLAIKVCRAKDVEVFVNNLQLILLDFLKFIPSSVKTTEGISVSLYDHLKLTACLSSTRVLSGERKATIISLDIGGIQKFISRAYNYEKARENATKRIRGRSFIISLLLKIISLYIIDKLKLSTANEIFCSAGNIIILSKPVSKEKMMEIKKELEEFFLKTFNGDLTVSVVFMDENIEEIVKNFGGVIDRVSNELKKEKARKFSTILDKLANVNENSKGVKLCEVCGNVLEDKSSDICENCRWLEELGEKLVKNDGIGIFDKKHQSEGYEFKIGNISYIVRPMKINEVFKSSPRFFLFYFVHLSKILNSDLLHITNLLPLFEYAYVPFVSKDGQFESLKIWVIEKEKSEDKDSGVRESILNDVEIVELDGFKTDFTKLCVGYFDLDNVGSLFGGRKFKVIRKDGERIIEVEEIFTERSLSRWTSMSFYISFFFSLINYYLAKRRNIYVIFSGGDDIKFFGSPYEVFKFFIDFCREFSYYFGERLSFSGGILINESKIPVLSLIRNVEDLEKEAKKKLKGTVLLLSKDYYIPYFYYDRLGGIFEYLFKIYKENKISKSALFRIFEISSSHIQVANDAIKKPIYIGFSKIIYTLKRNWKFKEEYDASEIDEFLNKNITSLVTSYKDTRLMAINLFVPVFSFFYQTIREKEVG